MFQINHLEIERRRSPLAGVLGGSAKGAGEEKARHGVRLPREVRHADQAYLQAEGIPPLLQTALGVQQLREERDGETWFTTISYWADIAAMTTFTRGEPTKVHHLARDAEFLIELPERIEIHRILIDQQGCGERLALLRTIHFLRPSDARHAPAERSGQPAVALTSSPTRKPDMTIRRTFVALAAAGAMLSTAASPVLAAPMPIATPGADSGVQQVQYRHGHGHGHRYGHRHHHHRHHGTGAAVLGGLAAGAIIGGAIANSQAQSNAASYCAQRYRSYDPGSGTYLGRDGLRHSCP